MVRQACLPVDRRTMTSYSFVMILSVIVAASENNVIGKNNTLPWHLPDDMKFFRDKTRGHPVIMGRKTYESLQSPLRDRPNIVITHQDLQIPDVSIVHSLDDAIEEAKKAGDPEIFVIGGSKVFEESLPRADRLYLTRVHAQVEGDVFFPAFDESEWEVTEQTEHPADEKHAYSFTFLTYERRR